MRTRSSRAMVAAALCASALGGLASAAGAATIAVGKPCYVWDYDPNIAITGAGFTPNASVTITLDNPRRATTTIIADGAGNLNGTIGAPTFSDQPFARGVTVTATEAAAAPPANPPVAPISATTTVKIGTIGIATKPDRVLVGKPLLLSVFGFPTGSSVWGHYLYRGKLRGSQRLARSTGVCGVARKRTPLVPARIRKRRFGEWTIQFDGQARYSASTAPRITGKTTIVKLRRRKRR